MTNEKTGALIARVRQGKGLTQQDLAERLGVTGQAVSKWETGRSFPDPSLVESLCGALELTLWACGKRNEIDPFPASERGFALTWLRRDARLPLALLALWLVTAEALGGWFFFAEKFLGWDWRPGEPWWNPGSFLYVFIGDRILSSLEYPLNIAFVTAYTLRKSWIRRRKRKKVLAVAE